MGVIGHQAVAPDRHTRRRAVLGHEVQIGPVVVLAEGGGDVDDAGAVGPVGGSLLFRLGVRLAEAEVAARHHLRSFQKRRRKPPSAKETAT